MTDGGIDAREYVYPLIGYDKDRSGQFEARQVYGTAFSIGGGICLTAGHSMQAAVAHEAVAIGVKVGDQLAANPVLEREMAPDLDIALCRTDTPMPQTLAWQRQEQLMLTTVLGIGYPYAHDTERATIDIRGRRGEIVAARTFTLLKASPRAYELSFGCPRGLSGAPLLVAGAQGLGPVCGVILQNVSTEMMVFGEEERLTEGGRETTESRKEFVVWGLAVAAEPLLDHQFALLKTTLGAWLEGQGLLLK